MRFPKKLLPAAAVLLALILGTVAMSAGSPFPMTYLPGTTDPSASVPAEEEGTNGTPFAVSAETPTRDGFEFIEYTLDTLLEQPKKISYTVKHIGVRGSLGPDILLEQDTVDDAIEGTTVTVSFINADAYLEPGIGGYSVMEIRLNGVKVSDGPSYEWTVADGDELTFYYQAVLAPTDPPTSPSEPTDPPTSPSEPTDPPTSPSEPANPPTSPSEPTNPPTSPSEPANPPTSPSEPETEPPTEPTNPPTSPSEPETEPPTEPTNPPTQPSMPELKSASYTVIHVWMDDMGGFQILEQKTEDNVHEGDLIFESCLSREEVQAKTYGGQGIHTVLLDASVNGSPLYSYVSEDDINSFRAKWVLKDGDQLMFVYYTYVPGVIG